MVEGDVWREMNLEVEQTRCEEQHEHVVLKLTRGIDGNEGR